MDDVFRVLADVHRRQVLICLAETGQTPAMVQVPEDIIDEASDFEQRQIEFYHVHLPELEQHGYIQWNRETHTVRRGVEFDEIKHLLRLLRAHEEDLPETLI